MVKLFIYFILEESRKTVNPQIPLMCGEQKGAKRELSPDYWRLNCCTGALARRCRKSLQIQRRAVAGGELMPQVYYMSDHVIYVCDEWDSEPGCHPNK